MICAIGRDRCTVSTRTYDIGRRLTTEVPGSKTIAGVMVGYGFTSAGTTYDLEDLVFFSSFPPQAPSLPNASYIDEPVVRKAAGTGGAFHYFHRNQQYSITAVTTSAGAVTERYAYTAYGLPTILDASASVLSTSSISNRYTYTAREWDVTLALHHFRARWMSPIAGRFLGRDPIGFEGSEWGLYEYCSSAPLCKGDPTGTHRIIFVVTRSVGCYACLTYLGAIMSICSDQMNVPGQGPRAPDPNGPLWPGFSRCMQRECRMLGGVNQASMSLACLYCADAAVRIAWYAIRSHHEGMKTIAEKCAGI